MSSNKEILGLLAAGSITLNEAQSKMEALEKKKSANIRYKVSQKGAISIYGLRRMPITLYIGELEAIVELFTGSNDWNDEFTGFLEENKLSLKRKD